MVTLWANTLHYKVSKNNDSMGMYLHLGFGLFIWLQIHVFTLKESVGYHVKF